MTVNMYMTCDKINQGHLMHGSNKFYYLEIYLLAYINNMLSNDKE